MKCETLLTLSAVAALLAMGCQPGPPAQTSNPKAAAEQAEFAATSSDPRQIALAAKDELFKKLSTRLIEAMSNGGPAAAIEVCSREAPQIAAAVGKEHGVAIGRTSFKLRNPKNAPPEWARPLIDQRSEQPEFVTLPDGGTGALLPIKLKTQCLACHGPTEEVADDVTAKLNELYPDDQATGFHDGDLRGWFWVVVPADAEAVVPAAATSQPIAAAAQPVAAKSQPIADNNAEDKSAVEGRAHGGRGMMGRGPGAMAGMRGDMTTIHAMFAARDKITRTVTNLPDGAETVTESADDAIASLIQEHVPAMEGRVNRNDPLPPMTFHPLFIQLIKHADDVTLTYEATDHGVKVKYTSDDPDVVLVIQEHAQLVSRFIKNGMEEIHKPYTIPTPDSGKQTPVTDAAPSGE